MSSVIVAVQTESGCPASPSLRLRSHRFVSVLKARSASTIAACGKTITPGEFRNVNPPACSPSRCSSLPSWSCTDGEETAWREDSAGCFSMEAAGSSRGESRCLSDSLPHPRPLTLHLHSGSATGQPLPCSSITAPSL